MSAAPPGSLVGLTYDSPRLVEQGDYLRTQTGRTYLVDAVRQQTRGRHAGRWHLRCIVVRAEDVAADGTVHPIRWYRR